MATKRHKPEEIVTKLRQVEVREAMRFLRGSIENGALRLDE